MISVKPWLGWLTVIALGGLLVACTQTDSGAYATCSSNLTKSPAGPAGSAGANTLTVTVNGSQCASTTYQNQPCVTVTICKSGTSQCQTIDNILLDTGSSGLRIFNSLVSESLTSVNCSDSGVLAECIGYGDGTSDWGPVQYADVVLGGEPAVTLPVQLINSNFSNPPAACSPSQSTPDTDPQEALFNGILGVGVQAQDCGTDCATGIAIEQYYSCKGSTCIPAVVPTNTQVANPVTLLPTDNNGVILELPSLGTSHEAANLTGSLILGIGTQTNNQPPGSLAVFDAVMNDTVGNDAFSVEFSNYDSGQIPGFIDSGSSILFIPPPTGNQLPDCGSSYGSNYAGYFCPSSTQNFTAENYSAAPGTTSGSVAFSVANAYPLLNSSYNVFDQLAADGGSGSNATFDWGLPFFFGKNVYVGIESTTSTLGTGPYWAY